MSALDDLKERTFTPEKMTPLDWVIWNSRASLPSDLLEQAAEQLKRQTPRPPCPECGKDFSHYTGCSRGVEIRKQKLDEKDAELLALRERVEKMAVILQWIYDDGEGGTYRPDIQAVLVAHNRSQ